MTCRSPSAGGCPRHVFSWKMGEEMGSSQVTGACSKLCSSPTFLLLSKSRPTAKPNLSGARRYIYTAHFNGRCYKHMAKDWLYDSSAEKEGRIGSNKSSYHVPCLFQLSSSNVTKFPLIFLCLSSFDERKGIPGPLHLPHCLTKWLPSCYSPSTLVPPR